jgi:hypothetical protein
MEIHWPSRYSPSQTAVHVSNELDMDAKAVAAWAWLIRADLWPSWYPNSANVTYLSGAGPDLSLGRRFHWKTFGVPLESVVLEFVPGERIAWSGKAFGLDVYHAWLIEPRGEESCAVLTEENQNGWMARLSNFVMPNRMHHYHQIWLEALQAKARVGLPPQV